MNPKYFFSKEKHIKVLEGLLKLPENKECADCNTKAPRWASTNLGIFICLRCSGIHRSLGVNISKVRSTSLDKWLPEQVAFMQYMGNKKSNAYWELELPPHYDRGQIENFIRAKYVEKRWIAKDSVVKSDSPSTCKQGLSSNCPSKRFGSIAEWTNNQHLCKERSDSSKGEKGGVRSSPNSDKVHEDCAVNQNEHQHQKNYSQPSLDRMAYASKSVHVKPSKELTQVSPMAVSTNGILKKSDQQVLNIRLSSARSIATVPFPNVDYAAELLRTKCVEDSANPSDLSGWVQFNSEQESSTQEAKIAPKPPIEEASKLITKSSTREIHPGPEVDNVQTSMVPYANGHISKHQNDVTNNSQHLSKTPDTVQASSIHLERLAMLAEGLSYTDAPKSPRTVDRQGINSLQHEINVNGGTVEHPTRTQVSVNEMDQSLSTLRNVSQMQNFQPAKLAVNSASDTMSSLYKPGISFKSKSTRVPPSALPVSGYDYDFSFLTQGMFKKR